MRPSLPNVVLVLALALCAVCAAQWVRESRLRAELRSLQQTNQFQTQAAANAEAVARRYEAEIARLDARVKELRQAEHTNSAALTALQDSLRNAGAEAESLRKQIISYKEAIDRQNENLRRQNEVITQQNASIKDENEKLKQLAGERNDLVEKLNARTKEFNDVVAKYNELLQQVEQLQKKGGGK